MASVLVTGAAGYIGSVLTRELLASGHSVRGLDNLSSGGDALCTFFDHPRFEFYRGDLRNADETAQALKGIDGIVHLAAIVGDPACSKDPQLAEDVNLVAAKRLYDLAVASGRCKRFVMASTCSNYGKMAGTDLLNEESALNPVSLYAKTKVELEKYILGKNRPKEFVPVVLRFSTAYGPSPRMRFDLTVNEFVREVGLGRELVIFGEQFWRPYCHTYDLARGCMMALEGAAEKVGGQVFGLGSTAENYTKKMLAEEILKVFPQAKIKYVARTEDPRDYRVDFAKAKRVLDFQPRVTVPEGIRQISSIVTQGVLSDPDAKRFSNI